MKREINLNGGEITLLKTLGLSGTPTYGKLLVEHIGDMEQAEFLDELTGLIELGYVLSDKVNVRTMEDFYQIRAISIMRIIVEVVGAMGMVGLSLALIGLYGLIAFSVARRTREIGIRMAIGAARSDVLKMVLGQGLKLSTAGICIGGLMSIAVSRALTAGLIGGMGMAPSANSATYIIVPILLFVVTLASCYLPALRASRTDPMVALRYE